MTSRTRRPAAVRPDHPRAVRAVRAVAVGLVGLAAACSSGGGRHGATSTTAKKPPGLPAAASRVQDALHRYGTGPCALVTAAEAQAALGRPVEPTPNVGGFGVCSFTAGTGAATRVVVQAFGPTSPPQVDQAAPQGHDVADLGDGARWEQVVSQGAPVVRLLVSNHTFGVNVQVQGPGAGGAASVTTAEALARAALARVEPALR